MVKNPKNITELRDSLSNLYAESVALNNRNSPQDVTRIRTATNVAGKIISTLRTQIEYHSKRKEKPCIPYIGSV